ncbi:hypothetical protein VMCG_06081 [Cytospora schulzeri]|uniref:N-acetyltransferase domain-containing protein n=1 Tax=Cytospora schulzeri TaxID=448051 RepID=A0A423WGI3_9PEZI|nr:hypothetical protein VMCG_06081 [Valsa malicola]
MSNGARFTLTRATEADVPEITKLCWQSFTQPTRDILMGCPTEENLPKLVDYFTHVLREDHHAVWLKVVENSTGRVAAAALWKIYPNAGAPASGDEQPPAWLEGETREASKKVLDGMNEARRKNNPDGFVQASKDGNALYKAYGFVDVGVTQAGGQYMKREAKTLLKEASRRQPEFNPLVEALVPFIFDLRPVPNRHHFCYKGIIEEKSKHWARDQQIRDAVLRPEASWRRMLPMQPANIPGIANSIIMDQITSSLQALSTEDTSSGVSDSSTASYPSLEKLPVELQRLVLSKAPNLPSLSALVHASPGLHRVYVDNRMAILRSVLVEALNGMLVDALGAYNSSTASFQTAREESLLWAFMERQEAKYTTTGTDWTVDLSLDDMIHLLRFHTSVIESLTERYATWALASLPSSSTNDQAGQQPLSDTERCRIQRAMYRLQIFCNVCGSLGEERSSRERIEDNIDRLRVLSMFLAWEIEEILCVHRFAEDIYRDILRQVAWDFNEARNPKYHNLDVTSVNEDLLLIHNDGTEHGYINPRSLNAVLRCGLQLLSDAVEMKDHEQLVMMMRSAIVSGMGEHRGSYGNDWIDDTVEELVQLERRGGWYSQRDSAQDFRKKMPFNGDRLDSPPLAWVLFWQGEYSNLIGNFIPEALRRWGFVMWDAARLNSRAKARIDYEWWELYGGTDPRRGNYDPSVIVS